MLTKIDIAALRKADRIVFRSEWGNTHHIEAIKKAPEATERDPFPAERRHRVEVSGRISDYAEGSFGGAWRVESFEAFEMEHSAQHSDEWQTIAGLLREGDQLILAWVHENNSPALRDAGVCRDELRLVILRGDKRLTFFVSSRVQTSTRFRMVRVTHKAEQVAA